MRFQQLNRDPNNVLRKKLVKSKKNWIVVSSLAIMGGLLFISSPTTIVKADVSNSENLTTVQNTQDDTEVQDQKSNINVANDSNEQNDIDTSQANTNQIPAPQIATPESEQATDQPSADTNAQADENNSGDATQSVFEIPEDAWASGDGSVDDSRKDAVQAGVPWYITQEGVLHIGKGTVGSNYTPFYSLSDDFKNKINQISIDEPISMSDIFGPIFSNLPNLKNIEHTDRIDVSNCSSLDYIFYDDTSLESVDLSSWDTSNVTNMSYMFANNSSLSNVTFYNPNSTNNRFNTKNVNNFSYMFASGETRDEDAIPGSLTDLDLSHFDMSSANSLQAMFMNQASLKKLDLSDWKTPDYIDMSYMLKGAKSLTTITLPHINAGSLSNTFANDESLTDIDVSKLDVSQTTDVSSTFLNNKSLKHLDLSSWDMSNVRDSGDSKYNTGFLDGTDLDYIILGSKNAFNKYEPYDGAIYSTVLPSRSGIWYNVDPNSPIKSFSGTDPNSSIGDIYTSENSTYGQTVDHVNPEGILTFVPNLDAKADVAIPSNQGAQVVKDVEGKIGQKISVDVPSLDGYTADKKTISANVNLDGTITTDETVKYTKKSSGGSSSNSDDKDNDVDQNRVTVEYKNQDVSTFNNEGYVSLYSRNSDDTMSRLNNRALAPDSVWFSNAKITINNESYYKVSTNEYVKASQVYPYRDINSVIRTNDGSFKLLISADGKIVGNRALAADSDWFTDRIATINEKEYYRVSTNEFVSVNDVYKI